MHDVLILAIKGLMGGALVVAFALLSQTLEPKRFAGLLIASPGVALAGLTVTLLHNGAHDAHQAAVGMIAGGVGMVAYGASVIPLLRRTRAPVASTAAIAVWTGAAALVALPLMLL
jgi:uncharacterized membrane protein (GlpM family)